MNRRSRRAAERQMTAELAAAQAQVRRLTDELAAVRQEADSHRDDEHAALAAVRQEADSHCDDEHAALRRENGELRRQLGLCERSRASLDEQIGTLQRSHDAMCREAVDRAGTLAPLPKSGEPQ